MLVGQLAPSLIGICGANDAEGGLNSDKLQPSQQSAGAIIEAAALEIDETLVHLGTISSARNLKAGRWPLAETESRLRPA